MSYNIPQGLLSMLQSGALPSAIKVVSNNPAGGAGAGEAEDGTWANPYRTIQAAIKAMSPPNPVDPNTWIEQVWIIGGTYEENVVIDQAKIIAFYTMGFVRLGIPEGFPGANARSLIWDMPVVEIPTNPVFAVFPMPMVDNANICDFEITGDLILTGESTARGMILQNTQIDGSVKGADVELPGAWTGEVSLTAYQSRFRGPDAGVGGPSIAFADGTDYLIRLERSRVEHGIFCETGPETPGTLQLLDTDVGLGEFTPAGDPKVEASVWLPGGNTTVDRSQFEDDVTLRQLTSIRGTFGAALTARDVFDIIDSVVVGAFTSTNEVGNIRRSQVFGAVDFVDATFLENSQFQGTFENDTGNVEVVGCLFTENATFGSVSYLRECRFAKDLTATATRCFILNTIVEAAGTVSFTAPANFYVDYASNSMTGIAGSSFPAGTNLLNDGVIP